MEADLRKQKGEDIYSKYFCSKLLFAVLRREGRHVYQQQTGMFGESGIFFFLAGKTTFWDDKG